MFMKYFPAVSWDTAAGMMFLLPKWKVGLGGGLGKSQASRALSFKSSPVDWSQVAEG